MAWTYKKRIKIIPGVHLNLSKNGISTSIGVPGANLNFGKSGTYLNTGIPGLGLHNRQKISVNNSNQNLPEQFDPISSENRDNIFSEDIHEITSQDMQGIKEIILSSYKQRKDLTNDLIKTKATLKSSKFKLTASYILLYGLIKKRISKKIKDDILSKKEAIIQIQNQIENCHVKLDIQFDEEIKVKYDNVVSTFKNLLASHKIWDITSANFEDRRITRSAASTVVDKKEVKFGLKSIADIKTASEVLFLKNANGSDLYIYPNFIIMFSSKSEFAIIGLDEIDFFQSYSRFVETQPIPKDTKIIDKTWAKVNKNGSPDKRFKDNYQIPIVKYGEISLRTKTGLNERYQFSNYEFTEEFGIAFKEYQKTINGLIQLSQI